jgi:cell wall-associated NlpC family hydrolase
MLFFARQRSLARAHTLVMLTALAASSAACATGGGVPRPFPGAPTVATNDPGATGAAGPSSIGGPTAPVDPGVAPRTPDLFGRFDGRIIAEFAMGLRGVPYRLGGSDPTGFDCSGLVQYVFAQYGITVPRIVEQQWEVGDKVKPSEIKPGDLIFFNTKGRGDGASHVGISIGGDSFVHAPNSTGVVRVETLGSNYWGARYVGARRIAVSN